MKSFFSEGSLDKGPYAKLMRLQDNGQLEKQMPKLKDLLPGNLEVLKWTMQFFNVDSSIQIYREPHALGPKPLKPSYYLGQFTLEEVKELCIKLNHGREDPFRPFATSSSSRSRARPSIHITARPFTSVFLDKPS
jgi:hypothetical protein